jgi:threonine synthase
MDTGIHTPQETICTISNAMDVGNPSNLKRIQYMFNNNINQLKQHIRPVSVSQSETKNAIRYIYKKYDYIIDPHTAVAYAGYQKLNLTNSNNTYVFISTAHPAKFNKTIKDVLNVECVIPELEILKTKIQQKTVISDDWLIFKNHLMQIGNKTAL